MVQASYEYDGSGRRVGKVVNGTRTDYLLLGHEVLKTYEDGQRKAKYFLGLSREGIHTDGSWKYYLTDGLGSTIYLTDEDGNPVASWDYSDYGETSQLTGDPGVYNPYLFTGQEFDAELGMYNLRARHYSPAAGRFIARDPIGYSGGSNLYAYCAGDPVNYVDSGGLAALSVNLLTLDQKIKATPVGSRRYVPVQGQLTSYCASVLPFVREDDNIRNVNVTLSLLGTSGLPSGAWQVVTTRQFHIAEMAGLTERVLGFEVFAANYSLFRFISSEVRVEFTARGVTHVREFHTNAQRVIPDLLPPPTSY